MSGELLGEGGARAGRRQGAHEELALAADVEQAGLEAEPDREADQDQRGRVDDRVDDRVEATAASPAISAP